MALYSRGPVFGGCGHRYLPECSGLLLFARGCTFMLDLNVGAGVVLFYAGASGVLFYVGASGVLVVSLNDEAKYSLPA